MAQKQEIPVLTTQDLWKQYVKSDLPLDLFFRDKPEEFLITRLEDTSHLMDLPTQPHRREVNEIVFVTNGKVIRGANLNSIEINTGEIHLTLANQISTVNFLSENLTGFYCHFSLETIIKLYHKEHMVNELSALNNYMQAKPVKLNSKAFLSVKAIFERLMDEYKTNNELSLIDAYLVTLCYEIKNAIPKEESIEKPLKAFELTEQFKQLIMRFIHKHKSISFYAQHLNVTPNHLNKVVKQATGKQASTLIAEMLVLEAKVLLKHSELSISEIAFKLGFVDQSYFSRFFKTHTGNTPREYKTQK
ncbi:MAG TPA: helix-turn-helix domain-containing protein [Fluviicola sp.]|nr:helix-turn-helix domain-containing protein [Fluviicola sp.]